MRPADDAEAAKIIVESKLSRAQDARSSPSLARDAPEHRNARNRTRQTPLHTGGGKTPMYQHFAEQLAAAMKQHGLNASEVARRIWGTTKDKRGYDVARNRDRIGHYLSGRSYPEPDNLRKLAEAVGLSVEQLAMPESDNPGPRGPRSSSRPQLTITLEPDNKIRVRGQLDFLLDSRRLQELLDLVRSEEEPAAEHHPELGSVIENHNQA